jgi:aspartyl-tRNA(Asn)/glutamyl-tRNA(Gln) amidotransferase subunit A
MAKDLFRMTVKEAVDWNKDADSFSALIHSLSERSTLVNQKINAYLKWNSNTEAFLKETNKQKNSLWGVPVSIKDNICIREWETTCGSKILEGYIPPYDGTVVKRLKEEGAFIFGKCNMDEFAFGSSCETSAFSPTMNPWDLERVPGGSSGGSASCVAADEAICALGSDTGGSIRQPASLCGVVGLKPTYGRVSRYGLIAFGSSLDQIGPITKNVEDNAILLRAIAGYDPLDSTSANVEVPDYTQFLNKDVKGLKIGIPKEYFIEGIDSEVDAAIKEVAKVYQSMGAELHEISLPHTKYAVSVYYVVATAEASSNLARFDGVQYGYRYPADNILDMYFETRNHGLGAEAKRRILLGTFVLSAGYYDAYYLRAQKVRTLIKNDFEHAFKEVDLVLCPTSPTTAFKLNEKMSDPLSMYLSDIYTISSNLAGIPAISVPCGFDSHGLPIGFQLMGNYFDESTIFRASYAYEQKMHWRERKPNL